MEERRERVMNCLVERSFVSRGMMSREGWAVEYRRRRDESKKKKERKKGRKKEEEKGRFKKEKEEKKKEEKGTAPLGRGRGVSGV